MRSLYDITFRMDVDLLPDVLKVMHDKRVDLVGVHPYTNHNEAGAVHAPRKRPPRKSYAKRGSNTENAERPGALMLAFNFIKEHPGAIEMQIDKFLTSPPYSYSTNTTGARLSELREKGMVWKTPDGKYYVSEQKLPFITPR